MSYVTVTIEEKYLEEYKIISTVQYFQAILGSNLGWNIFLKTCQITYVLKEIKECTNEYFLLFMKIIDWTQLPNVFVF